VIENQLNKGENSNKFSKAVSFGNNHEFVYGEKSEQQIAEGCKRLINNSIICWNYLYVTQLIAREPSPKRRKELIEQVKRTSMETWKHVNLHGEYDFSDATDKYRNKKTREAYHRNACQFFEWCEYRKLAFADIESFHVSAYVEEMLAAGKSKRTVKQHLATIRKLFDWLIVGQICHYNPAQAVEGPKISARKGSTPYLDGDSASEFLKLIDVSTIIGLRDRALYCFDDF